MASSFSIYVRISAAGLVLTVASDSARADEAYLCGPDTVVYVKPAELEHKKKTDACVASYFGLKVEPQPVVARQPSVAKPAAAEKILAMKTISSPEKTDPVTVPVERTAELAPSVPSPGTDYRNVKVINASSPSEQWFKHTR